MDSAACCLSPSRKCKTCDSDSRCCHCEEEDVIYARCAHVRTQNLLGLAYIMAWRLKRILEAVEHGLCLDSNTILKLSYPLMNIIYSIISLMIQNSSLPTNRGHDLEHLTLHSAPKVHLIDI